MKRISLAITVAAGAMAAFPAAAQQNQGGTVPPGREETVPLQLKAEQVAAMQQRLNERGFFAGRVDGLWGPDTSAAVRSFQQKNGLSPSGLLDPGTLQALGIADTPTSPTASPAAALPATPDQATPDQATAAAPARGSPPGAAADPATSGTPPGAARTPSAAVGATPAAPAASGPDGTPGTAVGRATDRALGTNTTGTNPDGGNAGQNAAAGDRNQAVATTAANAAQPAKGANSFTDDQARGRIESRGYSTVTDLKKDDDGIWRGSATKDSAKVGVWLDYKGNVGQQ